MSRHTNKIGRFVVAEGFFDRLAAGEGVNLFHNMIVLDVRRDFMSRQVEYIAIHPDFHPLPEGCIVQTYTATFTSGSPYPTWK